MSRTLAAIAVVCVEMQVVTFVQWGSLPGLVLVNAGLAVAALLLWPPDPGTTHAGDPSRLGTLPVPAIVLLASLAFLLNTALPLDGADPYHLQRVDQIERLGTLEFDPAAEVKVNILASVYELVLADIRQIPVVGDGLVHIHGVLGLLLYALAVAAVREWLTGGRQWTWTAMFALPVLFHQLVLVKNDLFGAVPGLIALCWLVVRAPAGSNREIVWASSLVGFAVAIKMASFPLALVMIGVIGLERRGAWRPLACVLLGGALGALSGGLPFTLVQTARWYGHPFEPFSGLGNRNTDVFDALVSMIRFGISLGDFGVVTRAWWPGRGGWGTTFGAPLIWSVAVLLVRARDAPEARRALWIAASCFAAFSAVYPDADIAHRLALAPALMLTATAIHLADGDAIRSAWLRRALVPALALSGLQIARSTVLYLVRGA